MLKRLTTAVTGNGSVEKTEEATKYVHDFDFVTVQLLKDTPSGLSLGQLCEYDWYPEEWSEGQKKKRI